MSYDPYPARGRIAQLAKGLCAAIAVAALVGGIPYLLCRFVGWPLPRHVPSWHGITSALGQRDVTDTAVIDVLAVALWICWAILVLAFVAEAFALARSRSVGRLPIAGRLQPLAGALLGTAVLAFAALAARPGGSGAGLPRAAITAPIRPPSAAHERLRIELAAAIADNPTTNGAVTNGAVPDGANGTVTDGTAPRSSDATYTVREGDTLWGIAERELGDATRWRAIFELNRGLPQPGGGALEHPHWIYPGWVLRLPAVEPATTAPSAAPSTAPPPAASAPSAPTVPVPATVPANPDGPVAPGPSTAPERAQPIGATIGRPQGAHGPTQGEAGGTDRTTTDHAAPRAGRPAELSSGDRLGGALVLAVIGALVALRLRRRQRYRPRAPRPGRHLDSPALTTALAELVALRSDAADDDPPCEPAPLTGIPSDDAFALPDRIEVGTSGEDASSTVELSLGEWSGLSLFGPGADDALRAWCAALLARSGPYFTEIVTTEGVAARLLVGVDFPRSVSTYADLDAVMTRMEAEFVARTRDLEEHDAPDVASYRRRADGEPFPFLLAIADVLPPPLAGRWRALAGSAGRLGATALLLGEEGGAPDAAPALAVAADGAVLAARPDALVALLGGAQLFHLDQERAADLLAPIAAVHNYSGPEDEPPPEDRAPEDRTADDWRFDGRDGGPPESAEAAASLAVAPAEPASAWPEPQPVTATLPPAEPAPPPILVQLLGPLRVEAFGAPVTKGLRRSAVELLGWYLLRPEGATSASAANALWPDASAQRGHQRFWTALGNLRTRLGRPEGSEDDPLEIVAGVGERYVPDAAVLDADLWRFEAALRDAMQATEPDAVIAALDRALAAYGGDFLEGGDDPWSEPAREDLHRRSLDAAFRLAALHEEAGRSEAAIAALRRALSIDPICEEAARRLARVLAGLGRIDEALAVRDELHARLDEVDLDTSRETDALFSELRRRQQRLRSHLPPADVPGEDSS